MHQPLESVTALARFSFTPTELAVAKQALLAEQDWSAWIEQIELHGLSGFANKHIEAHDLPVPQALKLPLKALNVRHRSASEARYQALSDINRAFKNHDIPYLALKGAALLPRLYQDPHLRPMRDMDLLLATSHENQAAAVLRELGYDLPEEQPSRFMRDMHQLPNATKTVNGFTCSVELHRDGISREVVGHLHYPMDASQLQSLRWQALEVAAFDDVTMLHQVCRHLEGLHPGGVLKLINVMDVIGLAEIVLQKGDWPRLESAYPHVINSLSCLHLLTPLPQTLQSKVPIPSQNNRIQGVGQIMGSLRHALVTPRPMAERLKLLLRPSDWWLHLYYNVSPYKSLRWVKWLRHPLRVSNWLLRRLYSGLLGG